MLYASAAMNVIYHALPLIAGMGALLRRRRRAQRVREWIMACVSGAASGAALVGVYMHIAHGEFSNHQIFVSAYWGASVGCAIRLVSWGVGMIAVRLWRMRPTEGWAATMNLFRAVTLMIVIVPYVLSILVIYRPHATFPGDPLTILDMQYTEVDFAATDGVQLHGWWIPAARTARTDNEQPAVAWGERTVILCHGFDSDKANDLPIVRDLAPNGYNILAFDFRAFGESGGQLTSFGDIERRDVLGAVRWLRANHPDECKKIFGVGQSMGAAALVGAAADESDEGQSIDAIALLAPFNSLNGLVDDFTKSRRSTTASQILTNYIAPLAGWQAGAKLSSFSPATEVDRVAPRPILVIGTERDQIIDKSLSNVFYNAASQPKYVFWLRKSSREQMLYSDDRVSAVIRAFFERHAGTAL